MSLSLPASLGLVLLASLAAAGGSYFAAPLLVEEHTDWAHVHVAGTPVHSVAEARALALAEGGRALERRLKVKLAGDDKVVAEARLDEMGIQVAADAVADRAAAAAKQRGFLARFAIFRDAQEVDVPITFAVDGEAVTRFVVGLKDELDTPPMSAKLDLDNHQVVPEKNGRYIDLFGSMNALQAVASQAETTVTLPVGSFAPRVSSEFVKKLDISTVISQYETHFSRGGEQARRGTNIDVASAKLDGLILSPGEIISFNAVVGERSEAAGFKKSWEISKGEMVEGVGGGTCQVASTFHAASFFSGLEILERLPHSRPSAYIPMGLDSTVVYPSVDLKMRNPHPFPVVVHARTSGNTLKVEILGRERPATVHFGREIVSTTPFPRKLVEETWLTGKKVVHKQHGIKGYRVRRTRELVYADGTKRTETSTDFYPPTADIYQVPVGFDGSLLPALPSDGESEEGKPPPAVAAAAPPGGQTQTSACTTNCPPASPASELEIVEGRGAHAPTSLQSSPSRSMHVQH